MMLAGHARIEWVEDAVRILAIQPDVTVVVRLEIMRLVERRRWIVDHRVVSDPME